MRKVRVKVTQLNLIHEAFLLVENTKGDFSQSFGYGVKDVDSSYIMASSSKFVERIACFKGQDYSQALTISHLLFHTSGLADWFADGGARNLMVHEDAYFSFDKL